MNQIYEQADPSGFGLEFNYAVWSPNTQIMLCNVPWGSDYRDIVDYDSQASLDNYLMNQSGPTHTINNMTYAQVGKPIRVNMPFHSVYKYNYLRAYNPAQPVDNSEGRAFYYFIQDVQYIAPNTTEIQIQLDVWQSFGRSVVFGQCYVERGHIGVANENQFAGYGRDYLTVPEGLDIGGEYNIVDVWSTKLSTTWDVNANYDILITSLVDLTAEFGTLNDPNLNSATGSIMEQLPNGAEMYVIKSLNDFTTFLHALKDKPWITQGIASIVAIPEISRYDIPSVMETVGGIQLHKITGAVNKPIRNSVAPNWRDQIDLGRYRHLKKFLTAPYSVLELTSYTGTPIVIKPESWQSPHAEVMERAHFASANARIMFAPFRYNAADSSPVTENENWAGWVYNDGGEHLDFATGMFNFPSFSIVNDGYMMYLASNAHSIAYQHQSADWSQQKAMVGNQLAYDQATKGIETSRNVTRQGINAAQQQTQLANETAGYQAIQSGINGAVSGAGAGAVRGGVIGGVVGAGGAIANSAATYAIGVNQRNQSLGISNTLAAGVNRAQTGQMAYNRDTNKDYADFAAQGDYQNAIASINAKVQDAQLTQPSTSGQIGGDAFNLAAYQWGYDVKLKMMQPAPMAQVGEYWLRYGYAVQQFMDIRSTGAHALRVMDRFTYWKLREAYIVSWECPESFKQAIRGIFEKGVTVWTFPDDIGNIDIANNNPYAGVSY